MSLFRGLRCDSIQYPLRGILTAQKGRVRPQIAPIAVTPAVGDAQVVQVPVHRTQRLWAIQIKDNVAVGNQHGLPEHNRVVFPDQPAAAQAVDDGFYILLRGAVQRPVLFRKVHFALDGARTLRKVFRRKGLRKGDPAERHIVVVEIRPARRGHIRSSDTDVYQNKVRTGQALRCLDDFCGHALDHRDEIGKRNRGNKMVVPNDRSAGKVQFPGARVDLHDRVIQENVRLRPEPVEERDEAIFRRVPIVLDIVDVGRVRRNRSQEHLLQLGLIEAGPHPFRGHVVGGGRVELPGILHGESFRIGPAVTGRQPVLVVSNRVCADTRPLDEVAQNAYQQVGWQAV